MATGKTNRDKLNSMAIYDLLCSMDDNMKKPGCDCIIDALEGNTSYCKVCELKEGEELDCRKCIASWLNEMAE